MRKYIPIQELKKKILTSYLDAVWLEYIDWRK